MSLHKLSLVVVFAGCAVDYGSTEQPAIATNAIATNAIATNAIATNAIATNAIATNAIATNAIATNGIATGAVAQHDVWVALHDPNARIFMQYLVSCALGPDQAVTWRSYDDGISATWSGSLGLCPSWLLSAPDNACRERVSSCILARNNALGHSVKFSMRGFDGVHPLALASSVPAHIYLPNSLTPVVSLQGPNPQYAEDNSGWRVASIGRCVPGTRVKIAVGNEAVCNSGIYYGEAPLGDALMRICDGVSACNSDTAIRSVDDNCGRPEPGTQFICPQRSVFSVMTAFKGKGKPGVIAASIAYPSTESAIFRWREGAFYGDIFSFDPGKHEVRINASYEVEGVAASQEFVGVVFPNMFACASRNWDRDEAYFHDRLCADPAGGHDCAAHYVGTCFVPGAPASSTCLSEDQEPTGDYDFGSCLGNSRYWRFPMTTILASPCDAVSGINCTTVSATPDIGW